MVEVLSSMMRYDIVALEPYTHSERDEFKETHHASASKLWAKVPGLSLGLSVDNSTEMGP